MKHAIERFQISGLHGYMDFDLHFDDNTLVIVGENGTGKTTVLRMLYYFLSGQWGYLAQHKFHSLTLSINGVEYSIPYSLVGRTVPRIDHRTLRSLPQSIRTRLVEFIETRGGSMTYAELEAFCDSYDLPVNYVLNEVSTLELPFEKHDPNLNRISSSIRKALGSQILYLPTYRRIEQELGLIFKGLDIDELQRKSRYRERADRERVHVELVEFGMRDVDRAVRSSLEGLKDFARENLNKLTLGYLGDVVDQEYMNVRVREIKRASEETITSVLDRIDESILSAQHRIHLFDRIDRVRRGGTLDEHAKVICHYFLKLLRFQQELQKKELQITSFCEVCNRYMSDKKFIYDSAGFTFTIKAEGTRKGDGSIELQHLSSGEKQIVSLFSHLYLSGEKTYFVLIDEPELSLSVPWQRRFLVDIKNGGFCSGLVAVTHSPFIYDNELRKSAHGLGEFVV